MTQLSAPPFHLLSLAEWEALDGDEFRFSELIEGRLLMTPPPVVNHQRAVRSLERLLENAAGPESEVFAGVGILLTGDPTPTVRIPDVLVTSGAIADLKLLAPGQVLLAVEVVSPGSRTEDHVHKRADYAAAGIPFYWVVDLDPFRLLACELVDGEYRSYIDADAQPVGVRAPFPVTVAL